MKSLRRRALTAGMLGAAALPSISRSQNRPIRIGGTLTLTGPLASLGIIHKLAGETFVDEINQRGGLLGRPVEWVLRDDQSKPELARTLYEQLVTSDKVDLLIGPYGTAAILAAMGVAQRYGKFIPHHSFGIPNLAKYEMQFQAGGVAGDPDNVWPNLVFDAIAASPTPPRTIAFAASKFPSLHYISVNAREIAKKRGLKEVAFLEYEFGTRDFGAIASRIKDAGADFLWVGAGGIDPVLMLEAMKRINYQPPMQFHMFPAPGPMMKLPESRNSLALTNFEAHPPYTDNPRAAAFVKAFAERAAKANLPFPAVDLQSAISYACWQVIEAAVTGAGSLDDKAIAQWLRANTVNAIIGPLRWTGPNNYVSGSDLYKVKQLQDGNWVVVWPRDSAAPGARIRGA